MIRIVDLLRRGVLAGVLVMAAGCVSGGVSTGTTSPAAKTDDATDTTNGGVVFGPITKAALDSGECGLIMWILDNGSRPTPVLRFMAGKQAEMIINKIPAVLTLVDYSGASGFGVSERQVFRTADGDTVTLTFQFGLGFDGGTYVERGLIVYENSAGWRTVAPAAGLAGCRS